MRRFLLCFLGFAGIVAFLTVTGCEGPEGPAGPAGTAECFTCHSENTTLAAIQGQWENSKHATGGNFERNYSDCKDCHTHEGFVERVSTNDLDIGNPSSIHCFTCHAPHTDGDFDLRTMAAVDLNMGDSYNKGPSNLCANCHQARVPETTFAEIAAGDSIESSRWGPHHGVQSNMLAGTGGYEFAGTVYGDSPHTALATEGCTECHMATPYGAQAGGHTMKMAYEYHGHDEPNLAGCNTVGCHGEDGLSEFNHNAVEDSIAANMAALRTKLLAAAFIDSSDAVIADDDAPLGLSEAQAGALYNYFFVLEDRSNGIHNYDYALALLKSALTAF